MYLIQHPRLNCLKIGVTQAYRVEGFIAEGWDPIESWWFALGYDALDAEERVLDRWRNLLRLKQQAKAKDMVDGGATETVRDTPEARADVLEFVRAIHEERSADPMLGYHYVEDDQDDWMHDAYWHLGLE